VNHNEEASISLVRLNSFSQGSVQITLLDKPVYCNDGEICSGTDFPGEVKCYDEVSNEGCWPCGDLPVGGVGVLMFVKESNCLLFFTPAENDRVVCSEKNVPVDFVLEQALREYQDCATEYRERGYDPRCPEESCGGCSHSAGEKASLFAIMILLFLMLRRR
jgi:hypothetical protein